MSGASTVPLLPGAIPLLGHAALIARDPLRFFDTARDHGPVVRVLIGTQPAYVVSSPELVRHMHLKGNGDTFDKGGRLFESADELAGGGLVTIPMAKHRQQRPLVQPVFHHTRLPGYVEQMARVAEATIGGWRNGQVIDVGVETNRIATGVLAETLFLGPGSREASELVCRCLPTYMDGVAVRALLPSLNRLPLPSNRRFMRAMHELHRTLERLISERRNSGTDEGDIVTPLLEAGDALSNRDVRDHLVTFLLAGSETTAGLLAWTVRELTLHPHIYADLQNEVDDVLQGAIPSIEHLPRLPLLSTVLTEAMRLHPPLWALTRATLEEATLGEHTLPPHADVFFSHHALLRDPRVFPEPNHFVPGRWERDRISKEQREAMIPFGLGPRKCIGEDFAMLEASVVVATLLQRFRLHTETPARVSGRARVRVSQRPSQLRVRLESRRPS
ncbi:cytochrome P450 [Streptomyces sp. NPDC056632]|uniref:cytochrome P450 n=1 Tax=Streptomyces sp. NPDC056632 TaxID=3345884 RepID=UPI003692E092